MHDLPLEGIHRRQGLSLTAAPDLLGHARTKLAQVGPAPRTEATDVQHQPSPAARLPVHCEPGQLLQSVKHLAAFADELVQRRADNRYDGASAPASSASPTSSASPASPSATPPSSSSATSARSSAPPSDSSSDGPRSEPASAFSPWLTRSS